jgi:hypothetical protein
MFLFLGERQAQIGNIGEITGPIDLPAITASFLTISLGLHQPRNPSHHPSPVIEQTRQYYSLALTSIHSAQERWLPSAPPSGSISAERAMEPYVESDDAKGDELVEKAKALNKKAVHDVKRAAGRRGIGTRSCQSDPEGQPRIK